MTPFLRTLLLTLTGIHLICTTLTTQAAVAVPEKELALLHSDHPLLQRRLGRITLNIEPECLTCGDNAYDQYMKSNFVPEKLNVEFLQELRTQLRGSGIFLTEGNKRLTVNAILKDIRHDYSKGGEYHRNNPVTAGGELVTTLTIRYELSDGEGLLFDQTISTQGYSNSTYPIAVFEEALDSALSKNLRIFMFMLKGAADPDSSSIAGQKITQIAAEHRSTVSIMGRAIRGTGKALMAIGSGIGATIEALGDPEVQASIQSAMAQMNERQKQWNDQTADAFASATGTRSTSRAAILDAGINADANIALRERVRAEDEARSEEIKKKSAEKGYAGAANNKLARASSGSHHTGLTLTNNPDNPEKKTTTPSPTEEKRPSNTLAEATPAPEPRQLATMTAKDEFVGSDADKGTACNIAQKKAREKWNQAHTSDPEEKRSLRNISECQCYDMFSPLYPKHDFFCKTFAEISIEYHKSNSRSDSSGSGSISK